MHIPDGFLDPKVSTGLMSAAVLAVGYSFAKVRAMVTALKPAEVLAVAGKNVSNMVSGMKRVLTPSGEKIIYKMGMVASLVFAAQMFNFPINQGTSGHLIGGVFAAVILGPFAGLIVIVVVLAVQSLFFADGGILALGANIINMSVFGAMAGYYIYYLLKKYVPEWMAILLSAWASVPLAALACAVEIGLSGTLPYMIVILAMVKVHMVIGIAEAIITLALIKIFRMAVKTESL